MPSPDPDAPSYLLDEDILVVARRYGCSVAQLVGRAESELAITYVSLRQLIRPGRSENAQYEALAAHIRRLDATGEITDIADHLYASHRRAHNATLAYMIVAATALARRIPIITTDVTRYNFVSDVKCISAKYVLDYPAGRLPPILVGKPEGDSGLPRPPSGPSRAFSLGKAWGAQILASIWRGGGRSK